MKWFKQQPAEQIEIQLGDRLHIVKSEHIGETFYWYDQDSGAFLLQGSTDEEIRTQLQQYWTDHIFIISPTHMIMGPDFDQAIEFDCQSQGTAQ